MVDVTARVTPVFPANVYGQQGVTVDKVNGAFYIGYNYDVYWSTKGDLLVRGDANPQALEAGPSTYVLTSNGPGELPTYQPQGVLSIPDGSITEPKYATESVSTRAIATGAVTSSELASNSVETVKILDANVTLAKMAADSVNAAKIVNNSVGQAEIAPNAVDLTEMALQTRGDIITYDISGNAANLAIGTSLQVLRVNAAGTDLEYAAGGSAALPAGSIIDSAFDSNNLNTTLTAQIPFDDTIPQQSEGSNIMNASVTPKSVTNKVRVTVMVLVSHQATAFAMCAALFRDSLQPALASQFQTSAFGGSMQVLTYSFEHVPGTTSLVTYRVNVGPQSGNMAINGQVGTRYGGGTGASSLLVEEIVV